MIIHPDAKSKFKTSKYPMSAVERGERNFTIDTLEKIQEALQVDAADLFRHDVVKNKDEVARRQATDEFIAMISNLDISKLRP